MSLDLQIIRSRRVTGDTCQTGEGNIMGSAWTSVMGEIQSGVAQEIDVGADGSATAAAFCMMEIVGAVR